MTDPSVYLKRELRLLAWITYFAAVVAFCFFAVRLGHMIVGLLFVGTTDQTGGCVGLLESIGWSLILIGAAWMAGLGLYGTGMVLSARGMRRVERYRLSVVMALVTCVLFPIGTVLGVLTLAQLSRSSVRALYGSKG